jgi:replicative DNA helicase
MDLDLSKNNKNRKKKPVADIFANFYGKIPPQDKDAEEAVLAAITMDSTAMSLVYPILQDDSFYVEAHQIIYSACCTLFSKGQPIDLITLVNELKMMGKLEMMGGPFYLSKIQNNVVSAANVIHHSLIIEEKAIARRLITAAGDTINALYTGEIDVFELKDKLQENIFKSTSKIQQTKNISPDFVAMELLKQIQLGMDASGMTGVPTGVQQLDELTGGLQKQNLIVLAARPRHGKSAVAAAIMRSLSSLTNPQYDPKIHRSTSLYPSGYLSMEMRNTELFARLVSAELYEMGYEIPYSRIQRGLINEEELTLVNRAIERLVRKGLYIDDTPALTPQVIRAKIMRMIEQYGIKIVFIDYIQLVQIGKQLFTNNAENLSQIMSEFKNIAKEFDIPIILLSQVDRGSEKQGVARRAVLAEMKGSGGIEEKTDLVCILYYPEINDPNPTDENGNSLRGIMELDIVKHKMGETKLLRIPFNLKVNSFAYSDGVVSDDMDKILNRPIF